MMLLRAAVATIAVRGGAAPLADRDRGRVLFPYTNNAFAADSTNVSTVVGTVNAFGSRDGTGSYPRFARPFAVQLSADGTFALISDRFNDRIRWVDIASWSVTTIAGSVSGGDRDDEIGTNAEFSSPGGLGIAADGSYALLADTANHKLRRIGLNGSYSVTTIAGNRIKADGGTGDDGIGVAARLDEPSGCAISSEGCFAVFSERFAARLRTVTLRAGCNAPFDIDGEVQLLAGLYNTAGTADGVGSEARFEEPSAVALYPDGSFVVVADTQNHRIRKVYIG